MSERYGRYAADIVDGGDIAQGIDVRPPFVPSEHFLSFCGEACGVRLEHLVSTSNVTRLYAVPEENWEGTEESRVARYRNAAAFLVKALEFVDEGKDITMLELDVWHDPGPRPDAPEEPETTVAVVSADEANTIFAAASILRRAFAPLGDRD